MSQNVTFPAVISPVQSIAVAALVRGWSITDAAQEAGVARETVSRWVHRDPAFIAELQNTRAEIAAQTRCALEALGQQAVATLRVAMENALLPIKPTRLRAACAALKLIGADRAETIPPTTREEVQLRLRQREAELRKSQSKLDASDVKSGGSIDLRQDLEEAPAAPAAMPKEEQQSPGRQDIDPATSTMRPAESVPLSGMADEPLAGEPANQTLEQEDARSRQESEGDGPSAVEPPVDSEGLAVESVQERPLHAAESKPGGMAEEGHVEGGVDYVHEWREFLNDVRAYLHDPAPGAGQTMAVSAGQEADGAVSGETLTELLHRTLSRAGRPMPPIPPAGHPLRQPAVE